MISAEDSATGMRSCSPRCVGPVLRWKFLIVPEQIPQTSALLAQDRRPLVRSISHRTRSYSMAKALGHA